MAKENDFLSEFIHQEIELNHKKSGKGITIKDAIRARRDYDYACITNRSDGVPTTIDDIIPDYIASVKKVEWQEYLIRLGIYTAENAPQRKTLAVKEHLRLSYLSNPPLELQKLLQTPRETINLPYLLTEN